MVRKGKSGTSKSFVDSFVDAFKVSNIFLKIFQFFIFGLVTATPYLIHNMNMLSEKIPEGAGFLGSLLPFLSSLWSVMWKGLAIGLSTVFETVKSVVTMSFNGMYGSLIYSAIVVFFATLTFFQPIRLTLNVFDMQEDHRHSKMLVYLISLVVVLVIATPLAYTITGGETITSRVKKEGAGESLPEDGLQEDNITLNQTQEQEEEDEEGGLTVDLTDGGS